MIPLTKVCTRCHRDLSLLMYDRQKSGKYGLTARCKECTAQEQIDYLKSERGRSTRRKWEAAYRKTQKGKQAIAKISFNYYSSEIGKAKLAAYNKSLQHKQSMRKWQQSPKGRLSISNYIKSPKGKMTWLNNCHHRRELLQQSNHKITLTEWQEIKKRHHYRCVYCGENKILTMDHIIPLSKGGYHTKDNIVPACQSCNSRKGNKPVLLQLLVMASSV